MVSLGKEEAPGNESHQSYIEVCEGESFAVG